MESSTASTYPVQFDVAYPNRDLSRLTTAFRILMVIPIAIVMGTLGGHDYWNWDTPGYLLFGFLPVGLWWQALVTILASIMMWLMVTLAWPSHLEEKISSDF